MEDKNQNNKELETELNKEPKNKLDFFWGKIIIFLLVLSAFLNLTGIFIKVGFLRTDIISLQGERIPLFDFQWDWANITTIIIIPIVLFLLLFGTAIGLILKKKYGFYLIYMVIFLGFIKAGMGENITEGIIEIFFLFLVGRYFNKRRELFK